MRKPIVFLWLFANLLLSTCKPPSPMITPRATLTAGPEKTPTVMPTVTPSPAPVDKPNFLIIISDDQRYDTMDYMPRTKARIFNLGVTFSNGYVTTPLCCPSRSSILTGLCARNHDVHNNYDPLERPTFVERFHEHGYYTGNVGKYLNSWDGAPRPEFDFWAVFAGHGSASVYFNPRLNINGIWREHPGYITYILGDYVLDFLRRATQQDKPFLLIFAPNAPHQPSTPAPGDEKLYLDLPPHRPPSFNEQDVSDKPHWLQDQPLWTDREIKQIDEARLKHLQSLNALDQVVDRVLTALDQQGKANSTVVIYISDNAVFWGEHRLAGKAQLYEEAIHVPFALRYPPLVPKPYVEDRLVANIDIAPTLYDLANLPDRPQADGLSLVPLLKDLR